MGLLTTIKGNVAVVQTHSVHKVSGLSLGFISEPLQSRRDSPGWQQSPPATRAYRLTATGMHWAGPSYICCFFVHTHVEVTFVVGRCQLELIALPERVYVTGKSAHSDRAAKKNLGALWDICPASMYVCRC